MNENKTLDMFNSMSVPRAVIKNAVPAIAAMIMVLIYNLADTFFIGQTHDPLQVAAVSLATPVFLIFMSLGTVFGIGGTSVISRSIGQGKTEHAKKVSAFCMWCCVGVGVIMSVLLFLFMNQILGMIGASPDTWNMTKTYLNIVLLCGPFVLIGSCFSNILRAEGQSTKAMTGMVIGNLLNILLDPIMIFTFKWGIAGAAIATAIGNTVGAVYYIFYFFRGKSMLSIKIKDVTFRENVCSGVLTIGIPASLGSLLMSLSHIVMNSEMAAYGDMALAGMGVAMKVTMITAMISIGIGQGIQPLLGYCIGAKNWDRYKKILKFSLWFALILGVVLTGMCYLFADQIVKIFLTEANAFTFGVDFSKILLITSALFGVFYVLINALQAMGAAIPSLIINLSRQGIIFIPAMFILNAVLGINGLVWAQPVADILSLILAAVLYISAFKRTIKAYGDRTDSSRVPVPQTES